MAKTRKETAEEPLEKKLWKAADKLRKNMDAAEYKHIVLGLIFLKYISDAFLELHQNLTEQIKEGADPEDRNEYKAEKVFYVPPKARWNYLLERAKLPTIGKDVDDAMDAIETDNPSLRGVLPKVYSQEKLDKSSLGGLIDLIANAVLGTKEAQSKDVLGKVYEYFLGEFALAEGKKGGQFYTPGSVVKLLIEMLEPYEGRVFDPCCGSGGMFVQSEKFILAHQDYYQPSRQPSPGGRGSKIELNPLDRISIYGQESNQTTWRLCKMNLAIRGIDSSNVKWNNEGSFLNDAHKDLKADYIIANPPFNDSDWSGELLREDGRWNIFGEKLVPPAGNANYAWIMHFLYHLAPTGIAGFVLSKGSLTTNTTGEGEIRKALIENDLVDCIVNLPTKLFLNTQIPACLWFLRRNKTLRKKEILFIDARNHGNLINRKNRELSDDDIKNIAKVYHNWRIMPSSPTLLPEGEGSSAILPETKPSPFGRGLGEGVEGREHLGATHYRGQGEGVEGNKQTEFTNYRGGRNFSTLVNEARELRKNQTPAEEIFWQIVRNRKFLNLKFRRQHQIGSYITDFYCNEKKLVIEIDGEIHLTKEQSIKDKERDDYLRSIGFSILRFKNEEIYNDVEKVLETISDLISPAPSSPALLPEGEGSSVIIPETKPSPSGRGLGEGVEGREHLEDTNYNAQGEGVEGREQLGDTNYNAQGEGVEGKKHLEDTNCRELGEGGNSATKKAGVVWHTQGSGKSLSMVFYTGKLVLKLKNPTIVVITDRNDLDDQLFDTFAGSKQLLRQEPVQAESREDLKKLLKVASGGIVFTTIQKFSPDGISNEYDQLSDRSNIVVIADEAHRTQYGFEAVMRDVKDKETKEVIGKRIAYGFAKYIRDALPNATYIGFTGTPIEGTDINTPQVFGNYIDIYDISQSVADGSTVRIYYESRLAKVNLTDEGKKLIKEFDDSLIQPLPEGEENHVFSDERQRAKAKWSKLEAIIGSPKRIKNLAKDIVYHFEERQKGIDGKGMIVAMSRRIAVDLYNEIISLRPEWNNDDITKGAIKVIMTAVSSDGPVMNKHHTTKSQRKTLSDRMKDPDDPLKLVIVRDMWLTGFDAPCLHTMYVDKPMRGHTLMQAIARVNRVFKDKPGGLVVDYLGIGSDLKKALSFYSDSGGKGDPAETQERAVEMMTEKLEVVRQFFASESNTKEAILVEEPKAYYLNYQGTGFNYNRFFEVSSSEKLSIILQAEEHIMGLEEGKNRFITEVTMLSQAFALSIPHEDALAVKDEIALFQAVKARLVKFTGGGAGGVDGESNFDYETTIRQIVDQALSSDEVVDIFDAAGIRKPEISILSDEFLSEVKNMKHKNLAIELLKKILNNEIKLRSVFNLVKSRALLEMLESSIKKYQNNLLTTAEIIQELIDIAKEIKKSDKQGDELGLTKDEVAFYNALEVNDSAVQVLGDETLKIIAREIADKVKKNATIDWTIRESARARLMVLVKRTLKKYGYPPDMQQKAVDTVLKQAELMADYIVSNN